MMDDKRSEGLDALIEAALSEESTQRAPLDFVRRIDERVRIIAMAQRGRRRFVQNLSGFMASASTLAVAGFFLFRMVDVSAYLLDGVPGMMGYADYLRVTVLPLSADLSMILQIGVITAGLFSIAALGALAAGMDRRFGAKSSQEAGV